MSSWIGKILCPKCKQKMIISIKYNGTKIYSVKVYDMDELIKKVK